MVVLSCAPTLTANREKQQPCTAPSPRAGQINLDEFNELVIIYQDAVFRQAFWIMGEEEAAEDATQEAFLRAYQHFHTYNGGPFLPWILRITTNYCLDQLRRLKTRRTTRLEESNEYDEEIEDSPWMRDPGASIEELIEQSETRMKIERCINRLPTDYRMAVILVDLQNLDYQEAASTLGIPLGTFKSRLSRARARLQKWLLPERVTLLQ